MRLENIQSKLLTLIIGIALFVTIPLPVLADTGPKKSVTVEFDLPHEGTYYATLLSRDKSTGPWNYYETYESYNGMQGGANPMDKSEWTALHSSGDSYYFLSYGEVLENGGNTFDWSYYPPDDFKVLLYDAENKTYYLSGEMTRVHFSSCYKASVDKEAPGTLKVKEVQNWPQMLKNFLRRCLMTIIVELLIGLIFYRKLKELGVIVLTNILTQVFLNVAIFIFEWNFKWYDSRLMNVYYICEALILVAEGLVYMHVCEKYESKPSRIRPWIYTIIAN